MLPSKQYFSLISCYGLLLFLHSFMQNSNGGFYNQGSIERHLFRLYPSVIKSKWRIGLNSYFNKGRRNVHPLYLGVNLCSFFSNNKNKVYLSGGFIKNKYFLFFLTRSVRWYITKKGCRANSSYIQLYCNGRLSNETRAQSLLLCLISKLHRFF